MRGGREIAIFHTANGQVYALANQCPHKAGPLSQGIVHDTTVTCPLHNWRISLVTGEALGADKGCVPVIPVKVDGGRILIGRAAALEGWRRESWRCSSSRLPFTGGGRGWARAFPKRPANGDRVPTQLGRLWFCPGTELQPNSPPASGRRSRPTCPYCGVGCGVTATLTGDRTATINGDPDHPANRGKLCSKGTHLGETIGLEGRLLHPLIGSERAGWHEALDLVASRFAATIAEYGPDSVAFYASGQMLTEDYYVANKLMKGFIGTANIDTNSRLCMASAVAAHVRAFGEDVVPCSYDDLDAADLIVLVGSNTAWCHPIVWQRIEAARATRGTKLVVIDPRRTETAERADLHLAIAPDSDVALFTGLLAEMRSAWRLDGRYLADHVAVPEGFWKSLPAADVAKTCDIAPADLQAFYDLFAEHPRTVTLFSQGVNQSTSGTDKANAIINLHLATGRIGKPGAGPFSITGQPNAMGGREVGGLASMLAAHMGFSDAERDRAQRFWQSPTICPGPGLKAVDMFDAMAKGKIKAVWIMATNPAVSLPDARLARIALANCPFVVVSDCIAATDTSFYAQVKLPAMGWGEKDGTVTNS